MQTTVNKSFCCSVSVLFKFKNGGPCSSSVKNYSNIQYGANLREWPLNSQDCTHFYIELTFSLALSMSAMSLTIMGRLGTFVFQRKCSMSASRIMFFCQRPLK